VFSIRSAINTLGFLNKSYKDIVITTDKVEALARSQREIFDELKRGAERLSDKIDRIERERTKAEAELLAKIAGLEARLNALSEQALHVVAKDVARETMERLYRGEMRAELPSPNASND